MVKNIWSKKLATQTTKQHNQCHVKNVNDTLRFPNYKHEITNRSTFLSSQKEQPQQHPLSIKTRVNKDRQRQYDNARVDMANYVKLRAVAEAEDFYTNPRPRRSSDTDRRACTRTIHDDRRRRSVNDHEIKKERNVTGLSSIKDRLSNMMRGLENEHQNVQTTTTTTRRSSTINDHRIHEESLKKTLPSNRMGRSDNQGRNNFATEPEKGCRGYYPRDHLFRKVQPHSKDLLHLEEMEDSHNIGMNPLIKCKELKDIALLRGKEGKWKESYDILQYVLQIEEDVIRKNRQSVSPLDLATTFFHIGITLNWLGDLEGALNAFNESFILRKTFLGEDHKDVASAQFYISMIQESSKGNVDSGSKYKKSPKEVSFNIEAKSSPYVFDDNKRNDVIPFSAYNHKKNNETFRNGGLARVA